MKSFLITILVLALLLLSFFAGHLWIYGGGWVVSVSSRNGYLQKFGSKKILPILPWDTYEGEIALHGAGGSNTGKIGQSASSLSNTWAFSVDNDEIAKQLQKIQDDENDPSKAVTLHYTEYAFRGCYGTSYRITKIGWLSNPNKTKTVEAEYFK